jgi:uncharacterized protein
MGGQNSQINRAVWFDIPVADLDRAAKFYREVLAVGVDKESYGDFSFCVIEHRDGNGGSVIQDTHPIGPHGFRAVVLDSEGNRIALHSETDA